MIRKNFFSGVHTYQKGYFDYETDGFGPVCVDLEDVIFSVEQYLLQPEGKMWRNYKNIADETFAFRDGKCCERTFKAIRRLQEAVVMDEEEQVDRLRRAAKNAEQKGFFETAISRYQQCFEITGVEEDVRPLIALLSTEKKYDSVLKLYEEYGQQWSADTLAQCLDALMALGCYKYVKRILESKPDIEVLSDFSESLLRYAAGKKNAQMFDEIRRQFAPVGKHSLDILNRYLSRDWEGVRANIRFASSNLSLNYFDLFLQSCFRTGCVLYAEQVFESISDRLQPTAAKIFATRIKLGHGDFDGAIKDYESIVKSSMDLLCREDINNWLKLRQYKEINSLISSVVAIKLLNRFSDDPEISVMLVKSSDFKDFDSFNVIFNIFSDNPDNTPPVIALFIFKMLISQGRYDEADVFVLNAAFAAVDVSDRAMIEDFQKINTSVLELA